MKEDTEFAEVAPWLVVLVTLLGASLRILLLASKGMWLDETFSVWLASHGAPDVVRWTASIDQSPPLYYLLLHYWMGLTGDSAYYVRLLSVLFGAATIPIVYLTGSRMSGPVTGFAAAVILALSPFHIRFSQEARMFTLLTFNVAIAIYALVRLLSDARSAVPLGSQFREYLRAWRAPAPPEPLARKAFSYQPDPRDQPGWRGQLSRNPLLARHRRPPLRMVETDLAWVAFVVFSVATLLTHNTGILFLLAANVFVLGLMLYRKLKKPGISSGFGAPSLANWVKAQVAIFVLWIPWIPAFARQAAGVWREFWLPRPGWDTVGEALTAFVGGSSLATGPAYQRAILWIPFALLFGLALVHFRRKLSQFLFLLSLFAIPILVELIVSLRRPVFYDRTLIWILIPLCLVLAAGVVQLRFRPLIFLALVVLGFISLFSAGDYFRFMQKENWNDAAGYVSLYAEPDDLIVFATPRGQAAFDYYFRAYEELYNIRVEKHGAPVDMVGGGVGQARMAKSDVPALASLLEGRKRAWLVYSRGGYADPEGLVPQAFASKMKLTRQRDFYGGRVQLYEAPAP